MLPKKLEVVKCTCGAKDCKAYMIRGLNISGGTVFEKEEARLIVRLWNDYFKKRRTCIPSPKEYFGRTAKVR